jgi:hypothetical protein
MKAFRSARATAPEFMSSCGIFPEVSESATDGLFAIVNDLATRELDKGRRIRALQKRLRQLAVSARRAKQSKRELFDRIGTDLTAVLAAEATAAYLFGLSVGLTVRTLPERIDR